MIPGSPPRRSRRSGPLAIRPNLIVNRRRVNAEAGLAELAGETVAKLFESIPGVSGVDTNEIQFKDGAAGVLLEFSFPASGYTVVQMHAMRIDDGVLTTMALSTEKSRCTPEEQLRLKNCLASAARA